MAWGHVEVRTPGSWESLVVEVEKLKLEVILLSSQKRQLSLDVDVLLLRNCWHHHHHVLLLQLLSLELWLEKDVVVEPHLLSLQLRQCRLELWQCWLEKDVVGDHTSLTLDVSLKDVWGERGGCHQRCKLKWLAAAAAGQAAAALDAEGEHQGEDNPEDGQGKKGN